MNRDDDFIGHVIEEAQRTARQNAMAMKTGMDYVEVRHRATMRALASAYVTALDDPRTQIPTPLHAMLEAVRREVATYPPVTPIDG